MIRSRISGVILAGGLNTRFGGITKAKTPVGGVAVISRIISAIEGLFAEIIIVTNTPGEFMEYSDVRLINDIFKEKGPLGGIHAAMTAAICDNIFVFAGDMPFIERGIVEKEIEFFEEKRAEIIIPSWNDNIEPLHAVYSCSLKDDLEKFLSGSDRLSIRDFISPRLIEYFRIPADRNTRKAFTNINSSEEANEANSLDVG